MVVKLSKKQRKWKIVRKSTHGRLKFNIFSMHPTVHIWAMVQIDVHG
jgi:hypothetical protein